MLRLLIDHNVDERMLRRLVARIPDLDVVVARELALHTVSDQDLLSHALQLDRVLLTHDASTIPPLVHAFLAAGNISPRVLVIETGSSQETVLSDLELVIRCSVDSDWVQRLIWLPL